MRRWLLQLSVRFHFHHFGWSDIEQSDQAGSLKKSPELFGHEELIGWSKSDVAEVPAPRL
jgi:hypothetical protein